MTAKGRIILYNNNKKTRWLVLANGLNVKRNAKYSNVVI